VAVVHGVAPVEETSESGGIWYKEARAESPAEVSSGASSHRQRTSVSLLLLRARGKSDSGGGSLAAVSAFVRDARRLNTCGPTFSGGHAQAARRATLARPCRWRPGLGGPAPQDQPPGRPTSSRQRAPSLPHPKTRVEPQRFAVLYRRFGAWRRCLIGCQSPGLGDLRREILAHHVHGWLRSLDRQPGYRPRRI
jgi:hypothetical protein